MDRPEITGERGESLRLCLAPNCDRLDLRARKQGNQSRGSVGKGSLLSMRDRFGNEAEFSRYLLTLFSEPCNNYPGPNGTSRGVWFLGRSKTSRGRIPRECATPVQAQGTTGGHYQGSQAPFLLLETRRKEAREGSFGAQAQPEKSSERTRVAARGPPAHCGPFPFSRCSVKVAELIRAGAVCENQLLSMPSPGMAGRIQGNHGDEGESGDSLRPCGGLDWLVGASEGGAA